MSEPARKRHTSRGNLKPEQRREKARAAARLLEDGYTERQAAKAVEAGTVRTMQRWLAEFAGDVLNVKIATAAERRLNAGDDHRNEVRMRWRMRAARRAAKGG